MTWRGTVSPEVPLSVVTLEPSRFKGEAALSFKAFRQADMHTTKDERIPKVKHRLRGSDELAHTPERAPV